MFGKNEITHVSKSLDDAKVKKAVAELNSCKTTDDAEPKKDTTHQATHQGFDDVAPKPEIVSAPPEVSAKAREYYKNKAEMDKCLKTERDCNNRIKTLEKNCAEGQIPWNQKATVNKEIEENRKNAAEAHKEADRHRKVMYKLTDLPEEVVGIENDLNCADVQGEWVTNDLGGCRASRTPIHGF